MGEDKGEDRYAGTRAAVRAVWDDPVQRAERIRKYRAAKATPEAREAKKKIRPVAKMSGKRAPK